MRGKIVRNAGLALCLADGCDGGSIVVVRRFGPGPTRVPQVREPARGAGWRGARRTGDPSVRIVGSEGHVKARATCERPRAWHRRRIFDA